MSDERCVRTCVLMHPFVFAASTRGAPKQLVANANVGSRRVPSGRIHALATIHW